MGLLSINTDDVQQRLSFFQQPPEPSISTEDAQVRAQKYDYTLGSNSPGPDTLSQTITSGNEPQLRNQMVLQKNMDDQRTKLQIIDSMTKSNNGQPLTGDQYDFIKNLTPDQIHNPDTIFESEYAKKVFSDMIHTNPDPQAPINQAMADDSTKAASLLDIANENLAKNEVVRKKSDELKQKQVVQNPATNAYQFLQDFIPFYRNQTLQTGGKDAGQLLGAPGLSIPDFLGEDLHDQYKYLRNLPIDQFQQEFGRRIDQIAGVNTAWAQQYIEGYMNETSDNRFWGDIGTVLDYSTLAPVGLGGEAKAVAGVADVAKGATTIDPIAQLQDVGKQLAQDYKDSSKITDRMQKYYDSQLADIEQSRIEEGLPLNDPEYNAARNQIIKQYSEELSHHQSITDPIIAMFVRQIKDISEAAQSNSVPKVLAAAGKTADAATATALKSVALDNGTADVAHGFNAEAQDLVKHIPSYSDPNSILKGPYNLAQGAATAIAETVRGIQSGVANALLNRLALERLGSDEANAVAIQQAKDRITKELNLNDSIASVGFKPVLAESNPLTNTAQLQIDFTRPGGAVFPSGYNAGYYASNVLGLKDFEVLPRGDGWFVRAYRPIDETTPEVRDALLSTENLTPDGRMGINTNYIAQHLRSADQLLGESQNENRIALVHGVQGISSALANFIKPISALNKASRANLSRVLTHVADDIRTYGPTKAADTLGDFTEKFLGVTGKLPTAKEASAFFATKEMYNFDWMLRNISAYTRLSRQGISNLSVRDKPFLGKLIDNPEVLRDGHYGILLDGDKPLFMQRATGHGLASSEIDFLVDQVKKEGYHLLQVADPLSRPFSDEQGRIINYVLTKKFKNAKLNLDVIPYDPSGFVKYDYRHSVVQPRISPIEGKNIYMGDSLVMHAQTSKQASGWASALEETRQQYKTAKDLGNGASQGLRDYIETHLPFSSDQVLAAFDKGDIHLDSPITSTPAGRDSIDNPEFNRISGVRTDGRKDPYNLVRGIDKIKDENPVLRLDQQKILDPLVSISRSLNRMTRNAFLNDYQIASAEQFVAEFKDVLDVPLSQLNANPIAYLEDPKWAKNVDPNRLALAKNFQMAAKNLMSAQSFTSKALAAWRGNVYESVFDKYGSKAADIANSFASSKLLNPPALARAAVMHMKIGMGNLTQFWKQLQTSVLSASMVGAEVSAKASGAMMMQEVLRLGKPEFLDHFDELATKIGLGRGHLTEIAKIADLTHVLEVEGEHIYNENLIDPGIISGAWGKVLDWGQAPWRAGERATRQFSLNSAYLEWRVANPDADLNRKAMMGVLKRQDTLNINMTKASQSLIQSGTSSFGSDMARSMLQFASYQMRVWELMMGHTITPGEKFKILAMQSLMYGVPIPAGITVPWPWFDQYRQQMLQQGKVGVGGAADWVVETVTKGIPETMMHAIFGKEYDFNTVYGAPNISIFHDAATGDSTMMDMVLGATGTTFSQIAQTTYPLLVSLGELNNPGSWNVVASELTDMTKNISSVNSAFKLYYAWNTSQALTRSGALEADDVTKLDGVLMSVFGVSPQELADVGNLISISQHQSDAKTYAGKQITRYITQMAHATSEQDQMANYKLAQKWAMMGHLDGQEFGQAVGNAVRDNASLFDKLNYDMMIRNANPDQSQQLQNEFFSGYDKAKQ